MNPIFRLTTALLLFVLALTSQAYERPTHRALSKAAAPSSILQTDPSILSSLGLKASDTFRNSENDERTIFGLIEDGSDFEDNFPRSRHHFYDPLNGQGLTTGLVSGTPSPDWALEDVSNITTQDYSYKHARDYLYKALTLPTQQERDQQFGQTFQTLGQVIHHLQDMAQPQHVRNDAHCDVFLLCAPLGQYNPSRYEIYSDNQREKGALPYTGYDPAMFDTARKFWTGGINGDGRGIADFTNRNFVSAGTNFDNPVYPLPFFSPSTEHDENANLLLQSVGLTPPPECLPPNDPCVMTFYSNPVNDTYRPAFNATNDRTSTWSIFDQDLKVNNLGPAFSLNRFNFDAAYPFLIPRAVAYSAGLIDFFFRGKLDFIAHPSTPGAYAIENLGNEAMNGTFELHYDDMTGNRAPVPGASWTLAIPANGQSGPLTFTGPTAPAPKTPGQYMLVFRGTLGQETDAVVGKLVHCTLKTNEADYPPPVFTGNSSYESAVAWLSREPDNSLQLNGLLHIKKHPNPPPQLRCFPLPGPPYCAWYLYYPASPYFNNYDPLGDRYTPTLMSGNEFIKVWIDLNGDRAFSNDELVYENQFSPALLAASWYYDQLIDIAAPLTVSPQGYCETMMRVALSWGGPPPGPYGDWAYGSVYDFPVSLK